MARFVLILIALLMTAGALLMAAGPPLRAKGTDDSRPAPGSGDAGRAVAPSADPSDGATPSAHFASLRADRVNLRTGPSVDYPIDWVFVRKGLPVEILASFETWRKIRDSEGTEGWVHQGMLSGRRSVLVFGGARALRRDPKPDGAIVAELEAGVVARLSRCDPGWCEVKAGGYRGWLLRGEFWGVEPGEIIQ
jgi:SH3-like domain-containing protein